MSENGGNGGSLWGGGSPWGGGYQSLDRKIDAVERDFRAEIGAIRVEMRQGNETILDRIDRASTAAAANAAKPTNPLQLIGTAVGIIALLGSWFGYVSSQLTSSISSVAAIVTQEQRDRIDDRRRLYDNIEKESAKYWSKEAHAEFERRVDERNAMEQGYLHETIARLDKDHDNIVAHMVPREEHDERYVEQKASQDRNDRAMAASLDRLAEHLNKTDENVAQKFSDIEKVIHGYGLADEVKDLQSRIGDIGDKFFRFITPFDAKGSSPKP